MTHNGPTNGVAVPTADKMRFPAAVAAELLNRLRAIEAQRQALVDQLRAHAAELRRYADDIDAEIGYVTANPLRDGGSTHWRPDPADPRTEVPLEACTIAETEPAEFPTAEEFAEREDGAAERFDLERVEREVKERLAELDDDDVGELDPDDESAEPAPEPEPLPEKPARKPFVGPGTKPPATTLNPSVEAALRRALDPMAGRWNKLRDRGADGAAMMRAIGERFAEKFGSLGGPGWSVVGPRGVKHGPRFWATDGGYKSRKRATLEGADLLAAARRILDIGEPRKGGA